jgi:hypothetical protein
MFLFIQYLIDCGFVRTNHASFGPEKNDWIHPPIVFFFFSLPDITLRFGTVSPSFARAKTTMGFFTF